MTLNEEDIQSVNEEFPTDSPVDQEPQETPVLPESPASLNIKFWAHGYGVMLTMRSETVKEVLDQFKVILPIIENAGYKNKWDEAPIRVLPEGQPVKQAPVCGIHGTQMVWKTGIGKTSGKPYAFWSCPTKNADNSYCKFSPPKENNAM